MAYEIWLAEFQTDGGTHGFDWSDDEARGRTEYARDSADCPAARLIRVTVDAAELDGDPFAGGMGDGTTDSDHPMNAIAYDVSDNLKWGDRTYVTRGVSALAVEESVTDEFLADCGYGD